jgi:uncharacterized protein YkwD
MIATRRAFLLSLAGGTASGFLGARSAAARGDELSDLEWHVLFVTNQQRIWRKLPALAGSEALAGVARAHSRDMLARGFFDHRTPEGLGPADRVARQGLQFPSCSENLYSIKNGPRDPAELASVLVSGWMETTGHRHNILDPAFRFLGVGAASSGGTVIVTQLFAS